MAGQALHRVATAWHCMEWRERGKDLISGGSALVGKAEASHAIGLGVAHATDRLGRGRGAEGLRA